MTVIEETEEVAVPPRRLRADRPWKCWCGRKGELGNHEDGVIPRHIRPDGRPCRQNEP